MILYELLTGKLPFDAKQPIEFIELHVKEQPISLSKRLPGNEFPAGLEAVVMRALAKNPSERWGSGAEFGHALESVLLNQGQGQAMPMSSVPPPLPPRSTPLSEEDMTLSMKGSTGTPMWVLGACIAFFWLRW